MIRELPESALLVESPDPRPPVIVDMRALGGLESAVHGALEAAGLHQGTVAIVLVPLAAKPHSWLTRISVLGPSTADEGLVVDGLAHEVHLDGHPVHLTVREFALLHYLFERRGALISREQLLREVWGERYTGGPRTVDIHIRRLRTKLGAGWLETTRGIGYKFLLRRR